MTDANWEGELEGLLMTEVHLDEKCCSCSGDPQCFGGVRHDAKDEG